MSAVYYVAVIQTREGIVEIEADSPEAACSIACNRFIAEGEELPEMDDCYVLQIELRNGLEDEES